MANVPKYRQVVISKLQSLEKLDNVEVTDEEKSAVREMMMGGDPIGSHENVQDLEIAEHNSFAAAAARRNGKDFSASP